MRGPYAVVLRFRARQPLPATSPEALHGAFLNLVRRADPALAAALHVPGHPFRPYALALVGPRQGLDLRVRLSVLAPDLFARFWERWERRGGFSLRLGKTWLTPVEVQTAGVWAGAMAWRELRSLPKARRVRLAFCTPTTFRQGDVDLPLPVPRLVFGGLLAKWNAAAPEPLGIDPEELSAQVVLAAAHIRTRAVWDGHARIWGFVGPAEFRVKRDASSELFQAVATLAAFAFFSGAGRHATHGFGLVRLLHAS